MATKSFDNIINEISSLTVLEVSELVKALETKFGVSAAMPVAAAATGAVASDSGAPKEEAKSEFKVELTDAGADKIKTIKALRSVVTTLTLTDAKNAVENAPTVIAEAAPKADADKIKKALEEAGAKVKLS